MSSYFQEYMQYPVDYTYNIFKQQQIDADDVWLGTSTFVNFDQYSGNYFWIWLLKFVRLSTLSN